MTNALYRLDRFEDAEAVIAEAKRRFPSSPQPLTQAALLHLIQGRVSEALSELEQALALDPRHALAHGLLSNIYLVQNKKDLALQAAQQAVAANPFSPSAYLDLSLVKQAEFRLEEALQAAQKAVALDPEDPQALIQVSRLLFGLGRLSKAFKVAEEARRRAPQDPLINTTWGFLRLARGKVQEAIEAFDQAIQADSTRGEPHLGRGLALFRRGKMEAAVQEMQMATLLEPQVSLFHSYLGKALYEVKRDEPAKDEFVLAKALDPRDPTPWFYDAILKQSVNRPVEALHDLQKSIELNDNRAVYRSRLLLDEDIAARGARLGSIYRDLGFEQLALVEGWKSVNLDPSNHSAHRLLADTYLVLPRHEIARDSELLQSQLLQPININPVQPRLADNGLAFLDDTAPAGVGFNEFARLFAANQLRLYADGIMGSNDTLADNLIHSGIYGNISYSIGQFHFETNGFRKNNDLTQNIYSAFLQGNLSYRTSVQTEVRVTDEKLGDRRLLFDPNNFSRTERREIDAQSVRLGVRHSFAPNSTLIASFVYNEGDVDFEDAGLGILVREDVQFFEFRHLYELDWINLTGGFGHFNGDLREFVTSDSSPLLDSRAKIKHTNAYIYTNIDYPRNIILTLGASFDSLKEVIADRKQVNPKFGATWNLSASTTLRAAAFRAVKRTLISSQTIEPTQVAGFNQFFDDLNATDAWRYGVAIDQKLAPNLAVGAEFSRRDLRVPARALEELTRVEDQDETEELGRGYFYWAPSDRLALSAEYQFERFDRDPRNMRPQAFVESKTHRVPLEFRVFHPSGIFSRARATFVDQEGLFKDSTGALMHGSDDFWVVDISLGYRLPRRQGLVTVGIRNLFDSRFNFQDSGRADPGIISPKRLILGRLTLTF
jgi:tetratricopeptide (TPR) repeat protein